MLLLPALLVPKSNVIGLRSTRNSSENPLKFLSEINLIIDAIVLAHEFLRKTREEIARLDISYRVS